MPFCGFIFTRIDEKKFTVIDGYNRPFSLYSINVFERTRRNQVETCENLIVMTIDPTAPTPINGAQTLTEITKNKLETFETFPTAPHDTCAILYTSGTTGQRGLARIDL